MSRLYECRARVGVWIRWAWAETCRSVRRRLRREGVYSSTGSRLAERKVHLVTPGSNYRPLCGENSLTNTVDPRLATCNACWAAKKRWSDD